METRLHIGKRIAELGNSDATAIARGLDPFSQADCTVKVFGICPRHEPEDYARLWAKHRAWSTLSRCDEIRLSLKQCDGQNHLTS